MYENKNVMKTLIILCDFVYCFVVRYNTRFILCSSQFERELAKLKA